MTFDFEINFLKCGSLVKLEQKKKPAKKKYRRNLIEKKKEFLRGSTNATDWLDHVKPISTDQI